MAGILSKISKGCIRIIKAKCKQVVASLYKLLPLYYVHLDNIPLKNWFKVRDGNFKYLNKFRFSYVPRFFYKNYVEMIYQMEHLDLSTLIKKGDQAVLNSMAARTKDKGLKFRADEMLKQIKDKASKETGDEPITLNDFINFIELTLNLSYSLNPANISASRGYSLFYQAKKKIEAIKKRNKPNVNN